MWFKHCNLRYIGMYVKQFFFFRFGKPLVIDMGSIDMFHVITTQVNNLQVGLMDKILDKSILLEEK